MAADVKWIKVITNFFSDEKILLIEQMPEGDTIIVIWFKLLCMAGKENNCGVFVMGNKIPYTDEMLATIFRRPIATVRLALSTFAAFGMIEIIPDAAGNEVYTIPKWEHHQNADGLEKMREQTRLRVAKHREKQRLALECNVTSNVTVTECNATEEEKEEDKEKEKKKNKNKKNTAPYVANDDLNNAIIAFIEYRKKIKKPMTERAIQLMLNKLNDLTSNVNEQIEILNQSILNGWQGIFPLNNQNNQNKKPVRQEIVPSWMNNRNSFNQFEQRDFSDYDELENALCQMSIKQSNSHDPEFLARKEELQNRLKQKYGKGQQEHEALQKEVL